MGQYNQAVITTAGQGLLAGVIASGKALAFTNAKTSTHIYPSGLEALTDITDVMQTDAVSSATVMSNTQVKISTRFTNEGITAAYDINTIGIFAKAEGDTNDTLFAVITAVTPDAMPKYTTTNPVAYIYDITVGMSNADSITLNVSPTGTPSYGDLAAAQTAAENASAANLAPAYDSTATYAKDDFCVNGGKLYQCNADISTAEAFNPAHWTEVKVTEVMGGGGGVTPEIMAQIENAQWKSESIEQLFSETVTTVTEGDYATADLAYSEEITSDVLSVVFNGTEYTCYRREGGGYGGAYNEADDTYDFSEYPFTIETSMSSNAIFTAEPGTYNISASDENITYTDAFKEGVRYCALKEVESLEEADIAIVAVTSRVASTNQGTNITIYKDNDTVQFLASSVNKYLDRGVYYFWKDNSNMLSNFAYRVFPSNDGLLIMDNAEIGISSGESSLNVYGGGQYSLASSNANWKFYNIGLTPSSGGGDGGGTPK